MTVAQVLRIQETFIITLQLLLLLPLPLLLHASPCPSIVEEITIIAATSEADSLAEALLCAGPGRFAIPWHGDVMLSRTTSVSSWSPLNATGSSETTDDADTGAVVINDGTDLLFEVDHGSTMLLKGLTFSGGNGAVRVADCSFMYNKRTLSYDEGWRTVLLFCYICFESHSTTLFQASWLSVEAFLSYS